MNQCKALEEKLLENRLPDAADALHLGQCPSCKDFLSTLDLTKELAAAHRALDGRGIEALAASVGQIRPARVRGGLRAAVAFGLGALLSVWLVWQGSGQEQEAQVTRHLFGLLSQVDAIAYAEQDPASNASLYQTGLAWLVNGEETASNEEDQDEEEWWVPGAYRSLERVLDTGSIQ